MKTVLDIETTVVFDDHGRTSPSPYDPRNSLVSVGYKVIGSTQKGYLYFHPNYATPEEIASNILELQKILDDSELVIGHNLKFDMSWLLETGFKYERSYWDTMIFEYIAAKGRKPILSLSGCAIRYNLVPKMDILHNYLSKKINVCDIPKAELTEYGEGDIITTEELYLHQMARVEFEADINTMMKVITLTNESLEVLIDIERAGIQIDEAALADVETQFRAEKESLNRRMLDMSRAVMGDKPVNFNSPEHMTLVVYSRKIKDKKKWAEVFGIGSEVRGAVRKTKYNRWYNYTDFNDILRVHTDSVYRTDVTHCFACDGKGFYYKKKVDGEDWKKSTKCPDCKGEKVIYKENGNVAGFKVKPISSEHATVSGFSTAKDTILLLLEQKGVSLEAKTFLQALARLNAIETYLTAFVEGIKKGIKRDGFCHPNFNQCRTATGRLSSSDPNWQNQPRGSTFPIRRAVISRWMLDGGQLLDIDFAQLEYRTAVMLANCAAGLESIKLGLDRHQRTAEVLFGIKKSDVSIEKWKELRQDAKPFTFAPLYGSTGRDEKQKAYKEAFYAEHVGIAKWHEALIREALDTRQIVTPSGRIFAFPDVQRISADRVTGKTQIVNYPVQSFATADIAWCVIIDLWRAMQAAGVKSKIILQVHDSITIDCHPQETEQMLELIKLSFNKAVALLTQRFKYVTTIPIGYEISVGKNLMEKKAIYAGESVACG